MRNMRIRFVCNYQGQSFEWALAERLRGCKDRSTNFRKSEIDVKFLFQENKILLITADGSICRRHNRSNFCICSSKRENLCDITITHPHQAVQRYQRPHPTSSLPRCTLQIPPPAALRFPSCCANLHHHSLRSWPYFSFSHSVSLLWLYQLSSSSSGKESEEETVAWRGLCCRGPQYCNLRVAWSLPVWKYQS